MSAAQNPSLSSEALERILEVTRQLATSVELPVLLAGAIDAARAVLDAERGSVFLYDAGPHELYSMVATGTEDLRFSADRGIVGEVVRTRKLINVPDAYADPRFNREIDKRTGYVTRCLLTIPLIGHDDTLVGVMQVLNKKDGVFTVEDERIGTALAAQCAVALQRARLLAELLVKERMERELAVARDIQMRVLPKKMPVIPGYDVAGWSRPADQTGGDIFDVVGLDFGRAMLLLGDATGHGIGPALSVTQVRAMLRVALRLGADLDSAYRHINDQLSNDLADNRFVTAFLGVLDPGSHTITYHAGGQGPLLCFKAEDGTCTSLGSTTVPMGFMAGMKMKKPHVCEMASGDIFALMTDGIFEYARADEQMFGEARVVELLRAHQHESMTRLIEIIVEAVAAFAAGAPQADDMTIVLARRLPA